jgi:hypothetical protein
MSVFIATATGLLSRIAEVFVARNTAPNLKELARQMARVDNCKAASHYFQTGGDQAGKAISDGPSPSGRERSLDDGPTDKGIKSGRSKLAADLAEARRATTTRDPLPEGHAENW